MSSRLKYSGKAPLRRLRQLRLKAGLLALGFAFFTLLPWAHVLTVDQDGAHACCSHAHGAGPEHSGRGSAPSVQPVASDEACWVCQGLSVLLLHADQVSGASLGVSQPAVSARLLRSAEVLALPAVYAACRSQAPPLEV